MIRRSGSCRGLIVAYAGLLGCGHAAPAVHTAPALAREATAARIRSNDPVLPLDWPVAAPLISAFGQREGGSHAGIDLRCPDGTAVRAAAAGEVVYSGSKLRGYGALLVVRHDARWTTFYAHNQRLLVAPGMRVRRGQVIAHSGHSGHATTPHLHFEVRRDGIPQNPLALLRGAPRRQ